MSRGCSNYSGQRSPRSQEAPPPTPGERTEDQRGPRGHEVGIPVFLERALAASRDWGSGEGVSERPGLG